MTEPVFLRQSAGTSNTSLKNIHNTTRLKESQYKASERTQKLRRLTRRKRKSLDDCHHAPGGFDAGDNDPGPSKRAKSGAQ